jgi:hypothetical protein
MLLNLDYFYQYLTPALQDYSNSSLLDPFFNLLASSTEGYLLMEYENYLEHSIDNLIPGNFDWVKRVTLSSTGINTFYIVQTGTEFAATPTTGIPVIITSTIHDSALSSFIFGIWPIYSPILISEDLTTVYYSGAPGSYLNQQLNINIFNPTTNYNISPDGLITVNTSTSSDFFQQIVGPIIANQFTFFNTIPPASVTLATNISGTVFFDTTSTVVSIPGFSANVPSLGTYLQITSGYGATNNFSIVSSSYNPVSSVTSLWINSWYGVFPENAPIFGNIVSSLQNFYIINGRYQNMKIWSKFGQTILDNFLPLISYDFIEVLSLLLDNWMSPSFADVVHNIIYQPTTNYWLSRAVQLVFGLPICVEDNTTVISNPVYSTVGGHPFTIIPCSSTSGIRIYFALGAATVSGSYWLNPTVISGTILNKYDLFFNQIYVSDYVEKGEFITNLFINSPSTFDEYLIPPYDNNITGAVNLLQRRIAAVVLDPNIPIIFTNYLDRIKYIFSKKFPAGFGYVTVNYTPQIAHEIVTGTDNLISMLSVNNMTQTYGFNVSTLVPVSTGTVTLGIDEDIATIHKDSLFLYSISSSLSGTQIYNIPA